MKKNDILETIKEYSVSLNCEDFKNFWNMLFKEEPLDEVNEEQKEDLLDLLIEEVGFFDKEKIIKLYNYLIDKM